jgi:hypothetical protein
MRWRQRRHSGVRGQFRGVDGARQQRLKRDWRIRTCDDPFSEASVGTLVVCPPRLTGILDACMSMSKTCRMCVFRVAFVRMVERRLGECQQQTRSDADVKNLQQAYSIVAASVFRTTGQTVFC